MSEINVLKSQLESKTLQQNAKMESRKRNIETAKIIRTEENIELETNDVVGEINYEKPAESQDKRMKRKYGDVKNINSQSQIRMQLPRPIPYDDRSDNCSTTNFEDTLFGDKKSPAKWKKHTPQPVGKFKIPFK